MQGELDKMSEIVAYNQGRELKIGKFLCKASSPTTSRGIYCIKEKQSCDISKGKARCICKEGWRGSRCEELISEPPSTLPTKMPTIVKVSGVCTHGSHCITENTECIDGECACKSGFTSRKGSCINVNECGDHVSNSCHRYAQCIDNYGGYECNCNDGFTDMNPSLPGRNCQQSNECNLGTDSCDRASEVCVDRPPPLKWECVEVTPSPTPKPSPKPMPPPTSPPTNNPIRTANCEGNLIILDANECECSFVQCRPELYCRIDGTSPGNTVYYYILLRTTCETSSGSCSD
jgi:hypothetical protein